MKIAYRKIRMNISNKIRLQLINKIVTEYTEQGLVLTLRQLYYQLVTKNVIENKVSEYSKLSQHLKEGRMSGIIDWSAIEDRLRVPKKVVSWEGPKEILSAVANQFRLNHQKGQKNYIEVWVEKDALSGVLSRVTSKYHVPILVNRGYSSASAMHESFLRFKDEISAGRKVTILYLGDFDPSGKDMVRDIEERILEFLLTDPYISRMSSYIEHMLTDEQKEVYYEAARTIHFHSQENFGFAELVRMGFIYLNFKVKCIGLTKEQIKKYNPPPNPAKVKDPRAKEYIAKYGRSSWEVDALRPEVLNELLEKEITELMDMDVYRKVLKEEDVQKKKLNKLIDKLDQ
jgi:hypothetical protein